jgi:dipeptidyl aminopeptidase/acylaminoacyl peptidase
MFGPETIDCRCGGARAIGDPAIFGPAPQGLVAASPPTYIAQTPHTDPPFLILQGDQDRTVPPYHSLRFYNELLSAGQPAALQMVQNADHEFKPSPSGATISPSPDQISALIVQFFTTHLAST